ncbi:MAG: hypothetical protein HYY76_07400 [Acidobacteria bacterium]|nr:hypothetical protein [Acidobacteriota bacterium]
MLHSHMATVEKVLLATAQIPAGSGHPLHKGTPRESFIKEFLENHLAESLAIGQGEVISSESEAGEPRNQFDIVLYKRHFPRLTFGGGINAFLVESVVATIEVKSTLDKENLRQAVKAARNVKALKRNVSRGFWTGNPPPAVLSFVVAYDGPAQMETVRKWLEEIHAEEGLTIPDLAAGKRYEIPSASIDGVFLLGRGFVQFDNLSIGFVSDEKRQQNPAIRYYCGTTADGTLLVFFVFLTYATAGLISEWPDLVAYLKDFTISVAT